MRHSKRYKRAGVGVELLCGTKVIAFNDTTRFANWQLSPCECGVDIQTTGNSPDTDRVQELIPVKIGNQFLAQ